MKRSLHLIMVFLALAGGAITSVTPSLCTCPVGLKQKKVRKFPTIVLLLFLLLPTLVYTQTRSVNASANKSWPKFYAQFSAAVKSRNHAALKRIMPTEKISCNEGWCTPDEMVGLLDQYKLWEWMEKAIASGIEPWKGYHDEDKGRPARTTKKHLGCLFVFRAPGRWYFVGLMGD